MSKLERDIARLRIRLAAIEADRDHWQDEANRLHDAIRDHRDARGDDRCWLDDRALYAAIDDDDPDISDTRLPPESEFLESCRRFWNQRKCPVLGYSGDKRSPQQMTIAQLEAELESAESQRDAAIRELVRVGAALHGIDDLSVAARIVALYTHIDEATVRRAVGLDTGSDPPGNSSEDTMS